MRTFLLGLARLAAGIAAVAIMVVPVVVVARLVGNPIPDGITDRIADRNLDDKAIIKLLSFAFYTCWLWFCLPALRQFAIATRPQPSPLTARTGTVRTRAPRPAPAVAGDDNDAGPRGLLARLVRFAVSGTAVVTLVAGPSHGAVAAPDRAPAVSAPVATAVVDHDSATVEQAQPDAPTVTAQRRDTPYSVAMRLFPDRVDAARDEIRELNQGRPLPGGTAYRGGGFPEGWEVVVPDRAPTRPPSAPTDSDLKAAAPAPDGLGGLSHQVMPGESYWAIATNHLRTEVGAEASEHAVHDYVQVLITHNAARLGHREPAVLHPGDVVELLPVPARLAGAGGVQGVGSADMAIVDRGESLWSIAEERLGAGERWSEIYELNEGRTFDDERALSDPDLIHPGWDLRLPSDGATDQVDEADGVDDADTSATESGVDLEPEPGVDDDTAGSGEVADPDVDTMSPAGDGAADVAPSGTVVDSAGPDEPSVAARPDNVWLDGGSSAGAWPAPSGSEPVVAGVDASLTGAVAGASDAVGDADSPALEDDHESADAAGVRLLTYERAGMLSVGVLMLLAVRRRNQMRRARPNCRLPEPSPRAVAIERSLRSIDAGDRLARVDIAIRHAAMNLVEADARVLAVAVSVDGDVELFASGSVALSAPWELAVAPPPDAGPSATRWRLAATTPVELLAEDARRVGAPCPTLVQLGCDVDGRDVFVDLEALEALEVDAADEDADAVVAAVASTLAASVLAEVTTLVGVAMNEEVFLGHRLYRPARDVQHAFDEAADAIGSTAAAERSTFDLRARVTSGETWEPAVVVVGSAAGRVIPPASRTGLALVSAAPIHGPSSRLAPDGDSWILLPLGIRLTPIGMSPSDVDAIAELASVPEPEPRPDAPADDPDVTLVGVCDDAGYHGDTSVDGDEVGVAPAANPLADSPDGASAEAEPLAHALIVRLLGPVSVESPGGEVVHFERSKTKELVAWLATHRERSTRSNARAALWELDVRDNTFANVVSEARRALARLVEPPDGEEWVGRTMTEALPLHPLVVTDLDLIEHALDTARLQPPNLAIETLTPAVALIKGVPFEGTSYLWPDAEGITSQLVMRAITVTNALAAHCLSVGDLEGVFAATSRGLSVIPAHEDMIAVRMRAYAQAGDRAGVRNEWETYERAIVSDPWSDGEPSDRMIQLRQELLS